MLLNFLPPWVKWLPVVIGVALGGYLYWDNQNLKEEIVATSVELADEQRRNSMLTFQLEEQTQRAARQSLRLESLLGKARVAQEENNRLNAILDSYKGKEEIALENPKDVELRANDAYNSLLLKFECETGNDSSCSE